MIGDPTTRECGTCCLCCKLIPFRELRQGGVELAKPGYEWCEHARPGSTRACAIYADRPDSCAMFVCGWRLGLGIEESRPDRSGVVVNLDKFAADFWSGMSLSLYQRDSRSLLRTRGGRALLADVMSPLRLVVPGTVSTPILGLTFVPGEHAPRVAYVRGRRLLVGRPIWRSARLPSWREAYPTGHTRLAIDAQERLEPAYEAKLFDMCASMRLVRDPR